MADLSSVFSINTRDLMDLARIRDEGPRIVQKQMLLGMEDGVNVLHRDTLDLTPRCRTGNLQGSLRKRIDQTSRSVHGQVKSLGSVAPYNRYVHNGRGPVVAKKGKALRLQLCDGTVLFRKRVRAAAANPFMDKGLARAEPKIYRYFDEAVQRIVVELGG